MQLSYDRSVSLHFWSVWILFLLADCPLYFVGSLFLLLIYRHSLQIKEICLLSVIYVPNSSQLCHWPFVFVYGVVSHAENCYFHVIWFTRFLLLWLLGLESSRPWPNYQILSLHACLCEVVSSKESADGCSSENITVESNWPSCPGFILKSFCDLGENGTIHWK